VIKKSVATIIIPCGPGAEAALDTADSVEHYCPEPHDVVFVDDCTSDGTYEALLAAKRPNWHILRNEKRNGYSRLVNTVCFGLHYITGNLPCKCTLKLDTDSLVIGSGVITDAMAYMESHPKVGMFGVYEVDYNGPRNFTAHKNQMDNALLWWRAALGLRPSWVKLLRTAESKGYRRGENVSGGGYFMTWPCLDSITRLGYLDVPYSWYNPVSQFCLTAVSKMTRRPLQSWISLAEDVYFSMATVAAGYKLGHFAAPDGPICVALRGLPYPAKELWNRGYKIVHGVDKGPNTAPLDNGGDTAREVFCRIRESERGAHETPQHWQQNKTTPNQLGD